MNVARTDAQTWERFIPLRRADVVELCRARIEAAGSVNGSNQLNAPVQILTGTLPDVSGQDPITPEVYTSANGLTEITARYLKFTAITGKNGNTGLNEIAVYGPEDNLLGSDLGLILLRGVIPERLPGGPQLVEGPFPGRSRRALRRSRLGRWLRRCAGRQRCSCSTRSRLGR